MLAPAADRVWLTDSSEVRLSVLSPANPVGFFLLWPGVCDSTGLPFQRGEEVEAEAMDGGESEIPPEAGASMVEALGGLAEADCSGGPILAAL